MLDKLFRPVAWERTKDWRLTQKWWANFKVNWKWMYWDIVKWRPYHMWLDYAWPKAWQSIPVYASHDWIAKVLSDKNWFGNYVVVEWVGYSTYYAHLDSISVKSWDPIIVNEQIGMMWSSWNSTAVHLHFGLKVNWSRVDPTPYITDRDYTPAIVVDPDIQPLIDDWIFNGNYEPMDYKRLIKIIGKLYNKVK